MRLFKFKKKEKEPALNLILTRFKEGDLVWVMNNKTNQPVQREIMGVRTQVIQGRQKTVYSFYKDIVLINGAYHDYLQYEPMTEEEKYFWVGEPNLFWTKEELLNRGE